MSALCVVLLSMLVVDTPGDDPSSLIEKLGAARYSDRQAASDALEKLGQGALMSLKQARLTQDLEIRNRASLLVDRIETNVMVSPTLVELDFRDRPLLEVVKILGERSQIPIALFPNQDLVWKDRRVTLERPASVPFWEALDNLCQAADLQFSGTATIANGLPVGGRQVSIGLQAALPGAKPVPSVITGPFRIGMASIQLHRERNYNVSAPFRNAAPAGVPVVKRGPGNLGLSLATEQFFASLQVIAEPRMSVTMTGPVKLFEVVDDLGQSLIPPPIPSTDGFQHSAGYSRFEVGGGSTLQVQAHLKYPARSSQVIRRFHGSLPLLVTARRDDPMVLSLAESKNTTFRNNELTLTLNDVRNEAVPPQTLIDLTIKNNASIGPGMAAPEGFFVRSPGSSQSQLEIVTATGEPLVNWMVISQNYSQEGLRMTLRILNRDKSGPPTQLRFYEMAKASIDAEFDFPNIEMP